MMLKTNKLFARSLSLLGIALICTSINSIESKRSKSSSSSSLTSFQSAKCADDECLMNPSHFYLYHSIKNAVESDFDIKGKEIMPLMRAVDVLKRRFYDQDGIGLNGSYLVRSLIDSKPLRAAIKIFESDEGRSLVDLYRSPVNGKRQNLACSQQRIYDIERASARLGADKELSNLFKKIHENYVKRSAKKCLKSSCTSIENSMSSLESVMNSKTIGNNHQDNEMFQLNDRPSSNESKTVLPSREFELEELELCKFFKKSNQSTCVVSGLELNDIVLRPEIGPFGEDTINATSLSELLEVYYDNSIAKEAAGGRLNATNKLDKAKDVVLGHCRRIDNLLTYNLIALKWYREQNYIDEQKLLSRTFWCPSLSYWLQVDRLCTELASKNLSIVDNSSINKPVTLEYQLDRTKLKPPIDA